MKKQKSLVGNRYGKLIVIDDLGHYNNSIHFWSLVRCDCGNEFPTMDSFLRTGRKYQCRECARKKHISHNMTGKRLYRVYAGMKRRCYSPTDDAYKHYGGRGIKICQEWLENPSSFFEWAYEHGYKEDAAYGECTIDRIDVNGDYCPENCRWADEVTQGNNKQNTYYVQYKGKQTPLKEVAKDVGIKYNTLYNRLSKGYSIDEAINLEVNGDEMHSKMGKGAIKRYTTLTNLSTNDKQTFESSSAASRFLNHTSSYLNTKALRLKSDSFEIDGYLVEIGERYKNRKELKQE